jgi:hypothetical protein
MKKLIFTISLLFFIIATASAQTTQIPPSVRVGAYTVTKNTEAPYLLLELFDEAGDPIAGSFSPDAMIKYIASKVGGDLPTQKKVEIYYLSGVPLPDRYYKFAGVKSF